MKRKIIKLGTATLVASLPSKWTKSCNLKQGDELEIDVEENELIVRASQKTGDNKLKIEITLNELTETSIKTLITNTYRRGYDVIKVNYDSEKKFNILQNILKNNIIGFEVIKKEENSCIVENITEPFQDQFDKILKKVFYSISELFETTLKRVEDSNNKDYIEIEARITRYDNFCRRIISKRSLKEKNSEFLWSFLVLIIHAQREIYHLNLLIDGKISLSKSTIDLIKDTEKLFNMIKEGYIHKDISILEKIHPLEKTLVYDKAYSLLSKTKGKENIIVYHLTSSIRRFYQANSPLLGLLI